MEIFIGADHRGVELKETLREWLKNEGHTVTDIGAADVDTNDDYPDYAITVARAVGEKPNERLGIAICGSGVGMAVVADKVAGVRAGLIHDPKIAAAARHDDNINFLALGADFITPAQAQAVVAALVGTPYAAKERYERRINKITKYEQEHSCTNGKCTCEDCKH